MLWWPHAILGGLRLYHSSHSKDREALVQRRKGLPKVMQPFSSWGHRWLRLGHKNLDLNLANVFIRRKQETDSVHITTACHNTFMITEDSRHPPVVHLSADQGWHSSQPPSATDVQRDSPAYLLSLSYCLFCFLLVTCPQDGGDTWLTF